MYQYVSWTIGAIVTLIVTTVTRIVPSYNLSNLITCVMYHYVSWTTGTIGAIDLRILGSRS